MWTAPQIVLAITQNSPGVPRRTGPHVHASARGAQYMSLHAHKYLFPRLPVCAHSCLHVHAVWDLASFSPTRGGPLSARWMVSASVSEVTAGWPGLSWPRVWILSSDSF